MTDSSGNVYPITQFGELLWTNPSPTESFANQNINVDLSNYQNVVMTFKASTTINAYQCVMSLRRTSIEPIYINSASDQIYKRDIAFTSSYVSVSVGVKYGLITAGGSTDTSVLIPYQIYGIR